MTENVFSYGQFISCTDLVDFQKSGAGYHKMTVSFELPITLTYNYTKIEIYRYIGDHMACLDEEDINAGGDSVTLKRIYVAEQHFEDINKTTPIDQITEQVLMPQGSVQTKTGTYLTDLTTFEDDFNVFSANGVQLRNAHDLENNALNSSVVNDIGFTRRQLFYIIKTYIIGVADSAPYLVTPDMALKTLKSGPATNNKPPIAPTEAKIAPK